MSCIQDFRLKKFGFFAHVVYHFTRQYSNANFTDFWKWFLFFRLGEAPPQFADQVPPPQLQLASAQEAHMALTVQHTNKSRET